MILNSCGSRKSTPFPENASGYMKPITKSFEYPEAVPTNWQEVDKDNMPVVKVHPFDLNKLTSKSFTVHTFKPLQEPIHTIPLNWDQLIQKPLNPDAITKDTFRVKSFLLPKPDITKANLPSNFPQSTSGILQMGVEEGLPSNYISETAIDSNGMIWISTAKGLVRYTGEYFETFDFLPKHPDGGADFIMDMIVSEGNILWTITESGEMYKLNLSLGLVQHPELDDRFAKMAVDAHGKIWFTAFESGTGTIDFKNRTVQRFVFPESQSADKFFVGVKKDSENNIWIGEKHGIYIINKDQTSYRFIGQKNGLNPSVKLGFFETKSGEIWINAFTKGAYSISANKENIRVLDDRHSFSGEAKSITEDEAGRIWIADNDTIFVLDRTADVYKKIPTGLSMFIFPLTGSSLLDNKGNVWIGTPQNKVLIIDPMGGLPEHLDMNDGLISNEVWGMIEDNDGLIWMATYNGINIYDPAKNKLMELTTENGLSGNYVFGISLTDDGRVLISGDQGFNIVDKNKATLTEFYTEMFLGTIKPFSDENMWIAFPDGIVVYNQKSRKMKKLVQFNNKPLGQIWDFEEDNNGKIWATSISGVYVIDPGQGEILSFGENEGLKMDIFSVIHQKKPGELWIGGGPGFSIINTNKQTITYISAEHGLYPETIYDMAQLNGRMYLGSQDGMVVVEPPESSDGSRLWRFYNYGNRNGYPFSDFNQGASLTTSSGQIWWGVTPQLTVLTQEPQIDRKKPKVFISGIRIMDQEADFFEKNYQSKIFNLIDTLWNKQLTEYNLKTNADKDSGYYAKHRIEWDSTSKIFNLPLGLKLPFDQNSVSFSFSNPDIKGRDKIVYRYILEGEDENWSRITNEPVSRNYYNLKHGNYSFKVATRGFNGVWSEPAKFEFTILPPWWLTFPAYLTYFLLLIGLIFLTDRIQRRRLIKKERERAREKELTQAKEIEKAYHELKTTQSQLIQSEKMASLGELTAGIAHKIQNPLNFMNNFSEVNTELIDELKEELQNGNLDEVKAIADDLADNEGKISHHGRRADGIVRGMLQHSRIGSGQKEPTDINALVDEYLRLSYHGLRAKDKSFNADFRLDADKNMSKINVVPQDMGRVLLNLINNAFHAVQEKTLSGLKDRDNYKPKVTVTTKNLGDKIEIRVKDNGPGIPDEIRNKIFQPFFTTKPTGQGTGLGLSMSYDIITKGHGGDIQVESNTSNGKTADRTGTVFIIVLPLK